jgi:hypothetical protein
LIWVNNYPYLIPELFLSFALAYLWFTALPFAGMNARLSRMNKLNIFSISKIPHEQLFLDCQRINSDASITHISFPDLIACDVPTFVQLCAPLALAPTAKEVDPNDYARLYNAFGHSCKQRKIMHFPSFLGTVGILVLSSISLTGLCFVSFPVVSNW